MQSFINKSGLFLACLTIGIAVYFTIVTYLLNNDLQAAISKQRIGINHASNLYANKLATEANSAYYLVSGLAVNIETMPDFTNEQFQYFAADITKKKNTFRNIATARDLIIDNVYPLEGNEAALGLDYRDIPEQYESVMRAIELRRTYIIGPINLVQGGEGFISRFPVFYTDEGQEKLWGIISTVIDSQKLYENAGLLDPIISINYALHKNSGEWFFGDKTISGKNPVISNISLPGPGWQLFAIPKDGWLNQAPNKIFIYTTTLIAFILYILGTILLQLYINRLAQSKKIAESANRTKTSFIANMSHEMRTPLNGILGYTHLLKESDLGEKDAYYANNVSQAAEALLAISNDLLDLAKLERGESTVKSAPVLVQDIIDGAIMLNQPIADDKALYIKKQCEPACLDLIISTDQNKLRQVICNLIDNALKFTKVGGITISYKLFDDKIIITVEDTGIGIDEKNKKRIFERFEQVEDIYSRKHKGAGLGLAICREIIISLGGTLDIQSVPNEGTEVFISLPYQSDGRTQEPV